ncbi:hypothetical protein [Nocardia gamkensis]|uniref:hypothetical protein n=1 Tax=Nocardia gamkensis TaxID=352869 RepID=UPI0037C62F35
MADVHRGQRRATGPHAGEQVGAEGVQVGGGVVEEGLQFVDERARAEFDAILQRAEGGGEVDTGEGAAETGAEVGDDRGGGGERAGHRAGFAEQRLHRVQQGGGRWESWSKVVGTTTCSAGISAPSGRYGDAALMCVYRTPIFDLVLGAVVIEDGGAELYTLRKRESVV